MALLVRPLGEQVFRLVEILLVIFAGRPAMAQRIPPLLAVDRALMGEEAGVQAEMRDLPRLAAEQGVDRQEFLKLWHRRALGPGQQIGRASCRERVCQYV